jgi:hypothetical protein
MPFRFEEATTPGGAPMLKLITTGRVELADAEAFGARVAAGGPNHRWRVLIIAEKDVEYSPASRKYFPTTQGLYLGIATVVQSAIVRAAINMMIRLSGGARDFRIFSDQAAALEWLDSL